MSLGPGKRSSKEKTTKSGCLVEHPEFGVTSFLRKEMVHFLFDIYDWSSWFLNEGKESSSGLTKRPEEINLELFHFDFRASFFKLGFDRSRFVLGGTLFQRCRGAFNKLLRFSKAQSGNCLTNGFNNADLIVTE